LVDVVAKINRRTASVVTDQQSRRVDFPLLRHVVEV